LSPPAQAQLPSPPPDGGYPGDNTAEGTNALFNLTTGTSNTAIGFNALTSNTTGGHNTAIGSAALQDNTEATDNTAVGYRALVNHAVFQGAFGNGNTAVGSQALFSDEIGLENTAVGFQALFSNNNTLRANDISDHNTAIGYQALYHTVMGGHNTAIGAGALYSTTGDFNTAIGASALSSNTNTGNTAIGAFALFNNTTGNNNITLGVNAGKNLTTGDNNIDIGDEGVAGEALTIRIGAQGSQTRTFIAGISGTALSGMAVRVNANGRLGTVPSSQRFKQDIKPMDKASEAILALKPVSFRYKHEIDPDGIPQFGLVAEDVAKVNPDLVVRDADGRLYTVRYEAVNAMLLNEFLKEHQKVQKLEAALAAVNKRLKAQDAKIDRVNAKVELARPASQVANNGP
jgi:hypothetical protein